MKRIIVTFWVIAAAMLALAYAGPIAAAPTAGYAVTPAMVKQFNRGFSQGTTAEGFYVTYTKCAARNNRRIVTCQYHMTDGDVLYHASVRLTRPSYCIVQATSWLEGTFVETRRQRICR